MRDLWLRNEKCRKTDDPPYGIVIVLAKSKRRRSEHLRGGQFRRQASIQPGVETPRPPDGFSGVRQEDERQIRVVRAKGE
jgi:hypothetical protein